MTSEQSKMLSDARRAAESAAREVLGGNSPALRGKVMDPRHIDQLVNEARLNVLEAIMFGTFVKMVKPEATDEQVGDLVAVEMLAYWDAVAKAIKGEL